MPTGQIRLIFRLTPILANSLYPHMYVHVLRAYSGGSGTFSNRELAAECGFHGGTMEHPLR
jgi:hypothetical protein